MPLIIEPEDAFEHFLKENMGKKLIVTFSNDHADFFIRDFVAMVVEGEGEGFETWFLIRPNGTEEPK